MGNPVRGDLKDLYPGQVLSADHLRSIYRGLNQGRAMPGAFTYGGTYAGGNCIIPFPTAAAAQTPAPSVLPPWYPFLTVVSGSPLANFYPGTIGGLVPSSGWDSIALSAGSVNYIYAQMTATAGLVTGVTLAVSTTYPTLAATTGGNAPTAFNIPIAIVDLTGAVATIFNIVGFGNIWCQPYVAHFDTINTGSLLTAPFTPWYNWEWGAGD